MTIAAVDFQMLANAGFPPKNFAAGAPIFEADEKGDSMFLIRSGEVEIERNGKVIETLGPGGIFGELALVDPAPRSATAVAGVDCSLARINADTFSELVRRVPGLALEVMRVMARRLRKTNPTH